MFVENYLPYLLAQAAEKTSLPFHRTLKQQAIKESEWRVLSTLYDAEQGMSISRLAGHVLVPQSTLSRRLDGMEMRNLVSRTADSADRRNVRLVLTRHGRDLARALIAAARDREDLDTSGLSADEIETLKSILQKLVLPDDKKS